MKPLKSAGDKISYLRLAILMALNGSVDGALAMLGLECSTFVAINRGTSGRSEVVPLGRPNVPSVVSANQATSRLLLKV